jgi:hypothetical protein
MTVPLDAETLTSVTPATRFSAFSILIAQEAQSIPSTRIRVVTSVSWVIGDSCYRKSEDS